MIRLTIEIEDKKFGTVLQKQDGVDYETFAADAASLVERTILNYYEKS